MHTPGYSSAKDGLDGSPLTLCSSFLISFLLFLSTDLILSKLLQFSLSGSAIQSAYLLGPPWLNMEVWNSKLNAYLFLLRHHFAKKIERFDPKTCLRKTEQSETCLKMWEVQDIFLYLKYIWNMRCLMKRLNGSSSVIQGDIWYLKAISFTLGLQT